MNDKEYWVYMLRVRGGRIYTGSTSDILRRWREHSSGSGGCRYTRSFPPSKIEACWKISGGRSVAQRIEAWIKKKSRDRKELFIRDPEALRALVERSMENGQKVEYINPVTLDIDPKP